jgi:hypothetical protein
MSDCTKRLLRPRPQNVTSRRFSPSRLTTLQCLVLVALGAPIATGQGAQKLGIDSLQEFPAAALREIAALQAGVTLGRWRQSHPADSLRIFERADPREGNDHWCARASTVIRLSSGRQVVRFAYFFPPPAPVSLSLPSTGNEQLLQGCLLGAVWTETPAADSSVGRALGNATSDALTKVYGAQRPGLDPLFGRILADSTRRAALAKLGGFDALRLGLHFMGSAAWHIPGRWQVDSTVVVSAFDAGFKPRSRGRVLAMAYLPFSGFDSPPVVVEYEEASDRTAANLAAKAARASGISPEHISRLLGLVSLSDSAFESTETDTALARARARTVDTVSVRVLGDWLTTAEPLDPPHRAAALLAADQVVGRNAFRYTMGREEGTGSVLALTRLGAAFQHDELGGGENYTHNWLREAWRLDSLGQAGQMAMLAMLRMGFNNNGMCGGGGDAFRLVTDAGERLLQSPLDSATASEVHFLVGDGYADVVALARGAGGEYADSSAYASAEPVARRKAIEHYRQGIALDHQSPKARAAWLEGWRLLAGLPPTKTHFFCIYD